ncbi:sugar ABC transporter substrate-binding protein [Murinocardiopsis flavida]|nr:sugar ABC transporter substrate-binding protein [Murinocardiopsis flavida]
MAMLSTAALLGLTACSGGGGGDDSGPLEVWSRSAPDPAKTYEKVFAAFTEKTGVKVDYKPVMEFDQQLQTRAGSKDLPDVLINDSGSLGNYQSQGLLTPIEPGDIKGNEDIADSDWKGSVGVDGKTYGIPFSRQAFGTFVNKEWREKLGKDVPETWADLEELATAFAKDDPDGNGKDDTYGMVVPGSTENGYLGWWASSYLWQGGGDIVADTGDGTFESAVASPENEKTVEWIRTQFCTKGNVQPGALTATTSNAPFFPEGTAGIYLTGPYVMAEYDKKLGKEKYEVIPTPAGPGGATTLAEGENIYFGAGSGKEADKKQLAEFLISPEGQEIAMTGTSQPVVRLPVNTGLDAAEVRKDDRWKVFQDSYENDAKAFPSAINFTPVRQGLAEGLNAVMADCDSDIPAALDELDTAINDELESQDVLK